MEQSRRRELRQARRERRQAEQHTVDAAGGGRRRLFRTTDGQDGAGRGAGANDGDASFVNANGGRGTSAPDDAAMMASAGPAIDESRRSAGAGPAPAGRRRAASRRNDAARLAEKMNQKKRKAASKEQQLTALEARVQDQYAPNLRELLVGLHAGDEAEDAAAVAAALTPAMLTNTVTGFDKDDLLAIRITETQANFLKLDQSLSEDHALATQKLHSAVFTHANDFLLLFRDVDRASRLVEALKSNVQGTKTAISTMSKFTFADAGSAKKGTSSMGSATASLFATSLSVPAGAVSVHGRISLVTERERTLTQHANDRGSVEAMLANQLAHAHHEEDEPERAAQPSWRTTTTTTTNTNTGSHRGGPMDPAGGSGGLALDGHRHGGGGGYRMASTASRATTRALGVASLHQWRLLMGAPTDILTSPAAARRQLLASTAATAAAASSRRAGGATTEHSALEDLNKDAEVRSREIDMFVALVREQLTQLLSERRHAEAAETLHEIADEAVRRGCLPLLLELETDLVRSVLQNLAHIPQSPVLHESAQVPLIQLLLQFGRVKAGVSVFLALQTPWIQSELLTLQSRIANPTRVCWIAADYLVQLMHQMLRRQQTLLLPTAEALKISARLDAAAADIGVSGGGGGGGGGVSGGGGRAAGSAQTKSSPTQTLDMLTDKLQRENKLIPPNSTALLWVRQNVELFAVRVLAAQVLSYGTGTDGGDPSRVRRAAVMTHESIRVLETISAQGSGATAASLTLRLLTPSLVLLETEFARLTTARLDNSGRAMVEQVITNALLMYETAAAIYQPTKCDDAVRKSNARCQWMEGRLSGVLPNSAHGSLVQLFLSPATTPLFMKTSPNSGTDSGATPATHATSSAKTPAKPEMPTPLFSQERYRFVRYATGCTVVHHLLLQSVVGFVCALGGSDDVLGSVDAEEVTRAESAASPNASTVPGGRGGGGGAASASPAGGAGTASGKSGLSTSRRQAPASKSDHVKGTGKDGHESTASPSSAPGSATSSSSSSPARCAALLLSNALILESVDITLYRLFISFLWTSLRERQSLVAYLTSDAFRQAQQKLFPRARQAAPLPFLCDPALSPAFVLDSLLGLVTDVLSTGAWISYLTRGGGVGHLLGNAQLSFRTQHLASLHSAMPGIVQGWLVCVLALGQSTDAAVDLLPVPCSATVEEAAELVGASAAHTNGTNSNNTSTSRRAPNAAGPSAESTTASAPMRGSMPGSPAVGSTLLKRSFGPASLNVAGVAGGAAVAAAAAAVAGRASLGASTSAAVAGLRAGGRARVQLLRRTPLDRTTATTTTTTTEAERALPGIRGVHKRALRLLPESTVRQSKLRALLMSILDRQFTTAHGFSVHHVLPSLPSLSQRRQELLQQPPPPSSSGSAGSATTTTATTAAQTQRQLASLTGAALAAWGVRSTIPSYPEFPIGGAFDRKDELFLLHWCAQINLHLLTLFQERLLSSSHFVNARAASAAKTAAHPASTTLAQQLTELKGAAPLQRPSPPPPPLPGGVSPQEDSALAGLCGGGGNYPTAVATLQFLVLRVWRDVLCQPETWSVVYNCASPAQWRQDEAVLRQQLFFFALFARFWSPLFSGGGGGSGSSSVSAASASATAQPPSYWNADGLPALAVLEWLTCGHAVFDMHIACVRRQRALAYQSRRTAADARPAASEILAASELTEEQLSAERQRHPRLQSAIDTYFDPQRGSGIGGGTGGGSAAGARTQGWKREDTLRASGAAETPLTLPEAASLLVQRSGPYVPDTLLRVLQYFFEEQLGETRAVPAITSDAMRNRVDKAMSSVNLLDFVGSSLGEDDDEEEASDDTASSSGRSSRSSRSQTASKSNPAANMPVTLMNLRDLLDFYVRPLL